MYVILKIGMDIVLLNLECDFLSVCHFPYRLYSHFLTVGLSKMEAHEMPAMMNQIKKEVRKVPM